MTEIKNIIYSAKMIPDFSKKTIEGASQWWNEMLELGFYIHPDDGAESCVYDDTGERALDDEASAKVDAIYAEMFEILGEEETYDAGTNAWWKHQGYTWSEQKQEWIKIP